MGSLQRRIVALLDRTGMRRPGAASRPLNLLRSFGVLSLVSIVTVGIVFAIGALYQVTERAFQREAMVSQHFIQSLMDARRTMPKAGSPGDASVQLEPLFEYIPFIPDVARANVYGRNRTLLWSTEGGLAGNRFESNASLERALTGELVFERVDLHGTDKEEHVLFGEEVTEFVEIYAPIWNADRSYVIGVAELYRTPHALFQAVADSRLIIVLGGIAAGLCLYLVLFAIVRRGARLLEEHERQLECEIVEHKRDKQTLRRSRRALTVMSRKLIGAQEQERKRIAAELHDGLGQSLGAIKYDLESALATLSPRAAQRTGEIIKRAVGRVRDAVDEVRRISEHLRPLILDDFGLLATIDWFVREFQHVYPYLTIDKQVGVAEEEVPEPLKIVIYRVMQEALNNVAKHAQADRVTIQLARRGRDLEFSVSENGRGFDHEAYRTRSKGCTGIGLQSMRERAKLSGGVLRIESKRGHGTRIEIVWPGACGQATCDTGERASGACAAASDPATPYARALTICSSPFATCPVVQSATFRSRKALTEA